MLAHSSPRTPRNTSQPTLHTSPQSPAAGAQSTFPNTGKISTTTSLIAFFNPTVMKTQNQSSPMSAQTNGHTLGRNTLSNSSIYADTSCYTQTTPTLFHSLPTTSKQARMSEVEYLSRNKVFSTFLSCNFLPNQQPSTTALLRLDYLICPWSVYPTLGICPSSISQAV
jgi:hypothetical protein